MCYTIWYGILNVTRSSLSRTHKSVKYDTMSDSWCHALWKIYMHRFSQSVCLARNIYLFINLPLFFFTPSSIYYFSFWQTYLSFGALFNFLSWVMLLRAVHTHCGELPILFMSVQNSVGPGTAYMCNINNQKTESTTNGHALFPRAWGVRYRERAENVFHSHFTLFDIRTAIFV